MSSTGFKLANAPSAASKPKLRALLVEDNQLDAELVLRALRKHNFEVNARIVQDEAGFTEALRSHCPDIVLADFNLPSWTGMAALECFAGTLSISR